MPKSTGGFEYGDPKQEAVDALLDRESPAEATVWALLAVEDALIYILNNLPE